jgi:hypothetical protein
VRSAETTTPIDWDAVYTALLLLVYNFFIYIAWVEDGMKYLLGSGDVTEDDLVRMAESA